MARVSLEPGERNPAKIIVFCGNLGFNTSEIYHVSRLNRGFDVLMSKKYKKLLSILQTIWTTNDFFNTLHSAARCTPKPLMPTFED